MTMTEDGAGLDIEPGADAADAAAGKSILDKISARRDERLREEVLTLDIPSWDGELRAKYRVVDRVELEAMIRKIRQRSRQPGSGDQASDADADFLVKACVGVVAYDSDTDDTARVSDGYDKTLAEMLGLPTERARELVVYLFKGNGIALAAHAMKVAKWMQDTSKPVDDDLGS